MLKQAPKRAEIPINRLRDVGLIAKTAHMMLLSHPSALIGRGLVNCTDEEPHGLALHVDYLSPGGR